MYQRVRETLPLKALKTTQQTARRRNPKDHNLNSASLFSIPATLLIIYRQFRLMRVSHCCVCEVYCLLTS